MAKKQINSSENQLNKGDVSKKMEKITKVKSSKATEIDRTLTRHAGPREVIERVKHKLYSIESGTIRYFNPTKGEGFIMPKVP